MRFVGAVGMFGIAWVVMVVGVALAVVASLDCIIGCAPGPPPVSGDVVVKFLVVPHLIAGFVAYGGARLLVRERGAAALIALGWTCLPLALGALHSA